MKHPKNLRRLGAWMLVATGVALAGLSFGQNRPSEDQRQASRLPAHLQQGLAGQSAPVVALLAGGLRAELAADGAELALYDAEGAEVRRTPLLPPRRNASLSVLPSGRVLVWGGLDPEGRLVEQGLWLDPHSGRTSAARDVGLLPRAGHSATVLADGRLLVLGGWSGSLGAVPEPELWDERARQSTLGARLLEPPRLGHRATLRADGLVQVGGGVDAAGHGVPGTAYFDAATEQFAERPIHALRSEGLPSSVGATHPIHGEDDVRLDTRVSILLEQPLDLARFDARTVSLLGPSGPADVTVVAVESGRLLFVQPGQDLFPATDYTLLAEGLILQDGSALPLLSVRFRTQALTGSEQRDTRVGLGSRDGGAAAPAEATASRTDGHQHAPASPPTSANPARQRPVTPGGRLELMAGLGMPDVAGGADRAFECEFSPERRRPRPCRLRAGLVDGKWLPGEANTEGRWRIHDRRPERPSAAFLARTVERLKVTTLVGQVLRVDDRPAVGVEVGIGRVVTRTDANGMFVLTGVPAGRQELFVDGSRVGRRARGLQYGQFVAGVDIEAGVLNELPYQMFIPQIAERDRIRIPSPLREDVVLTHPDMPGLEVHVPAGTVFRDRRGRILEEIALVPTPVNRAPVPVPENFPMYFTVEPGGAVIQGLTPDAAQGIRIHYPNYDGYTAQEQADFYIYDPAVGWQIYGNGRLNAAGSHFVPEQGVALHRMVGGSFGVPGPDGKTETGKPPDGHKCEQACGPTAQVGDPIDLFTGQFFYLQTDLSVPDIMPLSVGRHYRPRDNAKREFGLGMVGNFSYSLRLGEAGYAGLDVVQPNGTGLRFERVTGSGASGTWRHSGSQTEFMGAVITSVNDAKGYGYRLTLRDGSQMQFSNFGGRLLWVGDRFGNRITYSYDAGLISRISSPSGRYLELQHDTQNRVSLVRDHVGRQVGYSYHANGLLDTVTYPDGTTERYEYVTHALPGGVTGHRMTAVIDRRGHRLLENTYDTSLRAVGQTQANGTQFSIDYVAHPSGVGHASATVTQPDGSKRHVVFDATGYPAADTWGYGTPLARTTLYERDSATGRIEARTDPLGRRTEYVYNAVGQTTQVTYLAGTPEAQSLQMAYNANGDMTSMTDALGRETRLEYTAGCLSAVIDPLGKRTEIACTDFGQPRTITNPLQQVVSFEYLGYEVVSVTDPLGRQVRYRHDALGRVVAVEDSQGRLTRREYDLNHRVTRVVDARGQATRISYDGNGNVTRVTLPNEVDIAYVHDNRDRLVLRSDGLLQEESWTYDAMDRVKTHTDRGQRVTAFDYDVLGRMKLTTHADNRTVEATYDAADRLLSLDDSVSGQIVWTYDGFDRVLTETSPQGALSYDYDAAGRRIEMTAAGQAKVTYGYDDGDRLETLTQGNEQVQFAHDALGRRSRVTLPNGLAMVYHFDDAGQLTGIDYEAASGSLLGDLGFSYDSAGQRVAQTGSWASQALPEASTAASTFDDNNRMLSFNGVGLTYDVHGNLTSDGSRTLVWDARNQLVAIEQGGMTIASFAYDALGRRISRTEQGVTTTYLYDGLDAVQETRGGEVIPILTGLGIDERYARGSGANRHYFLTDALGSTIALADNQGAIRQRYHYTPYGQTTQSGDNDYGNPYQYTGRERDASGLYYYRARYYSAQMGRFVAEDPIGFGGGDLNFYAYVGGSPSMYVDPLGLFALPSLPQPVVDFAAGMGGAITFGATDWVRARLGIDGGVDPCSSYYGAGEWASSAATGGLGVIKQAGRRAVGGVITGYTRHGLNQAISREGRGVSASSILNAVRNPVSVTSSRGATVYRGADGTTVVLNQQGRVITTYGVPRGP